MIFCISSLLQAESSAAKARGYFTVGSTRDEVLGVQGTPSRFSDTHWTYGISSVEFQNGHVTTWNSSPLNPLRVALVPQQPEDTAAARARGYFTVGSTKDEVLGVQGTPSSFSDTHWAYGISSVSFQNGRVTSWKSSPLNPLRARNQPEPDHGRIIFTTKQANLLGTFARLSLRRPDGLIG
jgi:outer membrane protein assembly factor BamE (lipoprotein component of BamABCDE complex)